MPSYYYPPVTTVTTLSATSAVKTPTGNSYPAMTGNSLALTAGTWEIWATAQAANSGSNAVWSYLMIGIFGSNGLDNNTSPTILSSVPNLTVNSALSYNPSNGHAFHFMANVESGQETTPTINVTTSATVTLYAVAYVNVGTPANGRLTTFLNARKLS
jgi:hypothetical protein